MKPWVRNVVFLLLCLAVAGLVSRRVLRRQPFAQPASFHAADYDAPGFTNVVDRVDQAFAASWKAAGIEPVQRAPALAVARRLSLALAGAIPSLEEIRAFEAQPEAQRVQWWLSHLFEDRRSSDYLAERFARVLVGVEGGPFIIYRRHRLVSWLSDQIYQNRPYDEMVRELITSEGIWTTRPEVNFITVTVDQNAKDKEPDERKLASRVCRAFLGLRIDCVQCHNDKFGGPWKQKDFHQLAAFFACAQMSMTGLRDNPDRTYQYRYLGRPSEELVPPKVPFDQNLLPAKGPLRQRLAAWVTNPANRPFARALVNRASALLFNRPFHQPVDQIPLEGPFPPGMEILADDLIAHQYDLRRLIRVLAATRVFQLDSRSSDLARPATEAEEALFAAFPLTRLRPDQVAGGILQSSKLNTIDADSHVLVRITRYFEENDFLKRYGDAGEDEFDGSSGTISQRLVMMNGKLVHDRTKTDLVMNSATRIASVAPDDQTAIETAYLATLTRRPAPEERKYFLDRFRRPDGARGGRAKSLEDLFWTLINSTEFSWNH